MASVETNAAETEADGHCGKCGDQRGRDRSGRTLASVETNAAETEVDGHCGKCGDQGDRDRR